MEYREKTFKISILILTAFLLFMVYIYAVKIMLEKLETEGSIKDLKIKFQGLSYNLLQKEITVGDATAELPPLKIAGNLIELKSKIEKENDISVKFIPDQKPEFTLNFN